MAIEEISFDEFLKRYKKIKNPAIFGKGIGWKDIEAIIDNEDGYILFNDNINDSWCIKKTELPVASWNDKVFFLQGSFNKDNITKIDTNLTEISANIPIYSEFSQYLYDEKNGEPYIGNSYLVMNMNLYGFAIADKTTSAIDSSDELINSINLYLIEKRITEVESFLNKKNAATITSESICEKMNTVRRIVERILKFYIFYKNRELSFNYKGLNNDASTNLIKKLKPMADLSCKEIDYLIAIERNIHHFSHDQYIENILDIAHQCVKNLRLLYKEIETASTHDPGYLKKSTLRFLTEN